MKSNFTKIAALVVLLIFARFIYEKWNATSRSESARETLSDAGRISPQKNSSVELPEFTAAELPTDIVQGIQVSAPAAAAAVTDAANGESAAIRARRWEARLKEIEESNFSNRSELVSEVTKSINQLMMDEVISYEAKEKLRAKLSQVEQHHMRDDFPEPKLKGVTKKLIDPNNPISGYEVSTTFE
jgi:hypothetical protein